jgi:hypothetical protein
MSQAALRYRPAGFFFPPFFLSAPFFYFSFFYKKILF